MASPLFRAVTVHLTSPDGEGLHHMDIGAEETACKVTTLIVAVMCNIKFVLNSLHRDVVSPSVLELL